MPVTDFDLDIFSEDEIAQIEKEEKANELVSIEPTAVTRYISHYQEGAKRIEFMVESGLGMSYIKDSLLVAVDFKSKAKKIVVIDAMFEKTLCLEYRSVTQCEGHYNRIIKILNT